MKRLILALMLLACDPNAETVKSYWRIFEACKARCAQQNSDAYVTLTQDQQQVICVCQTRCAEAEPKK